MSEHRGVMAIGTLRVGDLSRALRITIGGASKLVDRIERAGLLARQPDPHDRRAALVALTPAGRHKLSVAIKTYEAKCRASPMPPSAPANKTRCVATSRDC